MASNSMLSALVDSTPHLLAYSIPLLLISIPLTFAGTFLTLDRSRSFPSSYEPVALPGAFNASKRKYKMLFALGGGVGGLVSGYVFGIQLSTFLSLLVPAVSSSAPLSPNSFLAVWILSCFTTTTIGGRYRYCALLFSAVSGGALTALALSVIIHPPLLPRQVLVVLFSILSSIVILLFCLPRFRHLLRPALRVTTASSGAFSLIVAIALLARVTAWADVWERIWLSNGNNWGTSKEMGLSVAYCIFTCIGVGTDWALKRWLGECPDEKWDHYLANYSTNLPNDALRAGIFKPLPHNSLLGRLFRSSSKKDILLPSTTSDRRKQPRGSLSEDVTGLLPDGNLMKGPVEHFSYDDLPSPGFLKTARLRNATASKETKSHRKVVRGRKRPVKFGGEFSSDSSSDDSGGAYPSDVSHNHIQPWLKQKSSTTSSTPTLVEVPLSTPGQAQPKGEPVKAVGIPDVVLNYSDYGRDLGIPRKSPNTVKIHEAGRTPGFTKQDTSSNAGDSGSSTGYSPSATTGGMKNGINLTPMAAVPATPSLIKALDRISAAQKELFGSGIPRPSSHAGNLDPSQKVRLGDMPMAQELHNDSDDDSDDEQDQRRRAPRWEEFWNDVRHKAAS